MNHTLRYLFVGLSALLLSFVLLLSCSKEPINGANTESNFSSLTKNEYKNKDYLFYLPAKVWIQSQDDPYDIENLKNNAQIQGDDSELVPTHFAVVLFPRNEIELHEIMRMDDIVVSYIPFGYTYVAEEIASKLDCNYLTQDQTYYGQIRYYVYREDIDESEPLPVLYATWPVSKPIPDEYEYEIAYCACLPSYNNHKKNSGSRIASEIRGSSNRKVSGFILDYDSLLNKFLPVQNLRIRLSYGLNNLETYTSAVGYFSFTGNINDNATVSIVYGNEQWYLANNSLFTYVVSLGKVSDIWGLSGGPKVIRRDSEPMALHRAADFFYNGNHEIETPSSNYSIRINMITTDESAFHAGLLYSPWIDIKLASYKTDNDYFKFLLHELGHFNHYQRVGILNYLDLPRLVKDSYADYISWYLTNDYYLSHNEGVYGSNWNLYLPQGNQWWYNTTDEPGLYYSPLFVDLIDDFDQSTQSSTITYNTDTVTGITHDDIADIVTSVGSWPELRGNIQDCICEHYPVSVSLTYLAPYDAFFASH